MLQYVTDPKNPQVLQPVSQALMMQPAQLNQQVQQQVPQLIIQQPMTLQQQQQLALSGLTFQQSPVSAATVGSQIAEAVDGSSTANVPKVDNGR